MQYSFRLSTEKQNAFIHRSQLLLGQWFTGILALPVRKQRGITFVLCLKLFNVVKQMA